MKISKKLNLVIPVEYDTGNVYAHSMPISSEVFETYFMILGKTFTTIYMEGFSYNTGPRFAALILKDIATKMGVWDDVKRGLVDEIYRRHYGQAAKCRCRRSGLRRAHPALEQAAHSRRVRHL